MDRMRLHLALCVALLCLLPSRASAGGFHITIVGVRRTGMMANLATPDDVTALFHNPAGLADLPGAQLHLSSGVTMLSNQTTLRALDPARFPEINPAGCGEAGRPPCLWPVDADGYYQANFEPEKYVGVIPYLGYSQNLGFLSRKLRGLTASVAVYAPNAYGASLPQGAPTAYFVMDGLFLVAAATTGVGWRINDRLSIGASLSYNYLRLGFSQKFSSTDVLTPAGQVPDATAKAAQLLIGDLGLDFSGADHGFGWGVGVLVTPWPWLAIGLTYSGQTAARFEGELVLTGAGSTSRPEVKRLSAEQLRPLVNTLGSKLPTALTVEMPIPPAFGLGASLRPSEWVEVALDFRLWLYSVFERQAMIPRYDPAEQGKEPMTEASLSKDKHYGQSYELAAGVLVRPFRGRKLLELMAGVAFDRSPVPDETFSIDNPSMNQLIFSLGVRARLGERWRVGAAYMLINYLRREITTSQSSPPVNVRISGTSHIPTFEAELLF
jgi:long-subunit fatty acid transport protein